MTALTRLVIAALVAVALLGGVAMVSADDATSDNNSIDWMHDRMADFSHGDHDHSDHDHSDHDHSDHDHSDHNHSDHNHDDHDHGDHHAGDGGC